MSDVAIINGYNVKDAVARAGLSNKQDTLVSGTNIKTINNTSLLGSGNIDISSGSITGDLTVQGNANFGGEIFNSNGDEINQLMRQRARSINETSKYINTAGWYRVFEYTCGNAAQAQGGVSAEFNISLLVSNNGNSSSNHRITLLLSGATAQFVDETSRSGVTTFNKIRYMTNGTKGYIDVYYSSSNNNYVSAEIESIAFYKGAPVDFTSVASAPSGETVRAEYTFHSNTLGDITLAATNRGTMLSSRAYRAVGGEYVFVNFVFKASTTLSNSPQCAVTINSLMDTPLSCIDITSGIGTAITSAVPCGISTLGRIYIKEIVTDHIYAVSGHFIPNQNS